MVVEPIKVKNTDNADWSETKIPYREACNGIG